MKKNETNLLLVHSHQPPTVEIDQAASSIYIRFKRGRVARTIRHQSKWPLVTVDLDADGDVLGVECVGVKRFNLPGVLKTAHVQAPAEAVTRADFQFASSPQPAEV
jgi:uncharacterized protein YuzE